MSTNFCPYRGTLNAGTGTPFCTNCGDKLTAANHEANASGDDLSPSKKGARRLLRSRTNRMLSGVCGGIGAYLGIDPTFVRIFFVVFTMATGFGVLIYLAMWVTVPREKIVSPVQSRTKAVVVGVAILVVLTLMVAVIDSKALPWILIVGGVGWLIYRNRTRRERGVSARDLGAEVDLGAEYEAAWCRRFNQAMAHQGDPTRIYPGRPFCPNCGAAIIRGAFCSHCGAKIRATCQSA